MKLKDRKENTAVEENVNHSNDSSKQENLHKVINADTNEILK